MSAWLLTAGCALCAGAAGAQSIDGLPESRFVEQRERFTPAGGAPIELRFLITAEATSQTARLVDATRASLTMMASWFGPSPSAELTVAGVPWRAGHDPQDRAGLVVAPLRWLTRVGDQATERDLIDGVVRQYWAPGDQSGGFGRAVAAYIATRAIHHQLEGSNFATPRFLGGAVPFRLRALLLSPPVADPRPRVWPFDTAGDAGVQRDVRALQTLERYVGWPSMLAALSALRAAPPSRRDAGLLAETLSNVRGTDMRFLVAECFRPDAVFDYALADLRSVPGPTGLTETTVTVARHGPGLFTTRSGDGADNPSVPLRVRFTDGTELRDVFDGAAPSVSLVYSAPSAAVSATVDPDAMLLVDVNRENNAITRDTRVMPLGVRLALHWMAWLQNAMLSYTALS